MVGLGICGASLAQAPATPPHDAKLAFTPAGTNEFTFDTGVLKGTLRAGGKSRGLSGVVHLPTGVTLDSSMGLFGHYRLFSANQRYGSAAWEWPSEARARKDGSVEVRWQMPKECPFALRAEYRWRAPNVLDLETSVMARTNLSKFESFLASYFAPGFTNASVYARQDGQPKLLAATKAEGLWQAFPRDDQAVAIIKDGRWSIAPNPVDWVIRPQLAKPLAVRSCKTSDLQAVIMSHASDAFAVLTPFEEEGHRSMYLSLFGKDLAPGEAARARARLVIATGLTSEAIDQLYADFLRQSR